MNLVSAARGHTDELLPERGQRSFNPGGQKFQSSANEDQETTGTTETHILAAAFLENF